MANNTSQQMREIIAYLRGLSGEFLCNYNNREVIQKRLEKLGAHYLSNGLYVEAYRIGKFVIKISSQSFLMLRETDARKDKVFQRFAPAIYWMHHSGYALICRFVEFQRKTSGMAGVFARRLSRIMRDAGFAGEDLHSGNMVLTKIGVSYKVMVIDYGCWMGNCY